MTALSVRFRLAKLFSVSLISLFLFVFLALPPLSLAQTQPQYTETPINLNTLTPQDPNYGNMILYNFLHTLSCIAAGQSQIAPCLEYKLTKNLNGFTQNTPILSSGNTSQGLLGFGGSLLSNLYVYKPIHTGEYLTDLGSQVGLVKPANAQVGGSGNAVLAPIFNLWKASRNFAYLAMILIFIVVGLMVMFRQKLNPQTVVTVQLALPGLVIGLVMITFSYFLASLITDLAYVGTGIVGYYFEQATEAKGVNLSKLLETNNIISLGSEFVGKLDPTGLQEAADSMIQSIDDESSNLGWRTLWLSPRQTIKATLAVISYQISSSLLTTVTAVAGGAALAGAGALAGGAITAATAAGAATAPAWIIPAITTAFLVQTFAGPVSGTVGATFAYNNPGSTLSLVISLLLIFVVLYAILRILIALLTAYLSLIIFTILAPFIFLFASLPGRSGSFTGWISSMVANALAFPAIMAALYLAAILMGSCVVPSFRVGDTSGGTAGACTPVITDSSLPGSFLTVYAQDTGVASKFALPGLGLLNNKVVNQGIAIIILLSASSLPGLLKESLAKGDRLGKGLESAFNQNMGGGRGWQTGLYAGLGAYTGSISKGVGEWRGNPPGSSKAEALSNLLGREPNSLPVLLRPHKEYYEAQKLRLKRMEGSEISHEREEERAHREAAARSTGMAPAAGGAPAPAATVDASDVDFHGDDDDDYGPVTG